MGDEDRKTGAATEGQPDAAPAQGHLGPGGDPAEGSPDETKGDDVPKVG